MNLYMIMQTPCPTEKEGQCRSWLKVALAGLVSFCTVTVMLHLDGWSQWGLYTKVVLTSGGVFCTVWALWVLHTFLGMISWWKQMRHDMDRACQLLEESKKELQEIQRSL